VVGIVGEREEQPLLAAPSDVVGEPPGEQSARKARPQPPESPFHDLMEAAFASIADPARLMPTVQHSVRMVMDGAQTITPVLYLWDDDIAALRPIGSAEPALRPGEDVAGQAFARREVVVARSYSTWQHASHWAGNGSVRTAVAVPLLTAQHAVGALAVYSTRRRDWSARQIHELTLLGGKIAPALNAALLYLAAERRCLQAEGAQRRLAFLAEASLELARSLDYETIAVTAARLAVPTLADWCAVDRLDRDGTITLVAAAHVDPAKEERVWELRRRYPPSLDAPYGLPKVLRTGHAEVYSDVKDAWRLDAARDADHLRLMRVLGAGSSMHLPLTARGRILGAVTCVAAESGRRYGPEDLAFAEDFVSRCALALANAELYSAARMRSRAGGE